MALNITVPPAHRDVSVQCLEAGLPVLCEKPMADSMEHARDMVAASERTGKLLMISQQRRYHPGVTALRRLVREHLGTLGMLTTDFYIGHPEAGFHQPMTSPLLLDMAIHTFDAVRRVTDADPVAVYCEDFNPAWSWFGGNASVTAVFEMTGGLRYTYCGSWCSRGHNTSWEAEWRVMGECGTAVWDGESDPEADILIERNAPPRARTRRVVSPIDPSGPDSIGAPLEEFLRALDTGDTPMGECHDNIKSLAMVFGALQSAATGRRISIDIE
jgi:predicted dehydrogenase